MTNRSRLSILLEIQRRGQGAFRATEGDVKRLSQSVGSLTDLVRGAAIAGGIAGVLQIGQSAFELAQVGAEAQRLRTSFDNLASSAGTTGNALLSALRSASRGAISDSNLILAANRANLLGVADTAKELSSLLEVARARGSALGLSTQQAFDNIVTGIGRESALILDNLGIIVDIESAQNAYASSLGRTSDSLTDVERKQAIVNQILENSQQLIAASAGQADDAASKFERLSASYSNLQVVVGEQLINNTSGGIDVLTQVLDVFAANLSATNREVVASSAGLVVMGNDVGFLSNELQRLNNFLGLSADISDRAAQGTESADRAMIGAARSAQHLHTTVVGTGDGFLGFARKVVASVQALNEFVAVQRQLDSFSASTTDQVFRSLAGVSDIIGEDKALSIANQTATAAEREVEALKAANLTAGERAFREQQILDRALGVARGIEEQNRAAKKLAAGGVKEAQKEFDALKNKVSGVLSGALDVGVGSKERKLIEKALGREDAINEDARRLADVAVRGYDSPWAEYLNRQFPQLLSDAFQGGGDIKTVAAQALRDFEDGLRPELLDKERAKERVRRMLTGEQNLAALGEEIARELAGEFGTTAGPQFRQQVNRALGVGTDGAAVPVQVDTAGLAGTLSQTFQAAFAGQGADGAGAGAGASFGQGVLGGIAGIGTQAVQLLDAELRSDNNLALLSNAGRGAGRRWGNAFLDVVGDNVPGRLIDILVNLVTPGVEGQLRQNESLTQAAS